jgi:outer membrane protein assembly factor BamD (BamD/ComL family)
LNEITEQLAYKEYATGQYYQRTGNIQSANLYYNMVVTNWPESAAAKGAKNMLSYLSSNTMKNDEN